MTLLKVWRDGDPDKVVLHTDDPRFIRRTLISEGVVFYQWPLMRLNNNTSDRDILSFYAQRIANLNVAGRYQCIDVARAKWRLSGAANIRSKTFATAKTRYGFSSTAGRVFICISNRM